MYLRALEEGLFSSQRKLAEDLGLQSGNVSTAINIARFPKAVIEAFGSPLDIQYRWSAPLSEALKSDPELVLSRANEIAAPAVWLVSRFQPQMFTFALSVQVRSTPRSVSHIVKFGSKGSFRVSVSKDKVAIDLPNLSKSMLLKVEKAIVDALKEEGALP
jgi:ParB family chromosome partitioning protein